ncbi:MAG: hypothetical protein Q7V15_14445 [Phenylobacterium sp.]|uniref:hypothetical protein n=1 Tax=Phenylobacterium sp. TaxID=1871053 RepID=UPI00271F41AB|nr:hypothetical protein [Phenylobacterium sp.]MDO8902543.1 hypothetical protein [Phenylobacterium sp.]MDP2215001.1 hypothetical protein [Phenylobacterium sp.]
MLRHWEGAVAGLLGLGLGANGLFMLWAPFDWYEATPGVVKTGPFNGHFVRDVGAAYLVCAVALAVSAWKPRKAWPALLAAGGFLSLHAGVHLSDTICGRSSLGDLARDLPGVFLPALLTVGLGLRAATEA